MTLIPWDLVVNTLKGFGFNAMAGFVEFYKNREKIIANFTDKKRKLANIGKYEADLFDKYAPHTDPLLKELIKFGPEYLASVVPDAAIKDAFKMFIQLGKDLEIMLAMEDDKVLQKVASYGGELKRIQQL